MQHNGCFFFFYFSPLSSKKIEQTALCCTLDMTEDSGGAADHTVHRLSADEEAALLAEYGTEGPWDDGAEWAAASRFHSQLGGGDVFLTVAAAFEEDGVNTGPGGGVGTTGVPPLVEAGHKAEYSDPLALYLLRHVPSLILPSRSTPFSLAQGISTVVSTIEDNEVGGGDETSRRRSSSIGATTSTLAYRNAGRLDTTSRFDPVLRRGKEWERRASLAVHGVPTAAFASYLLSSPGDGDMNAATPSTQVPGECGDGDRSTNTPDMEYERLIGTTASMLQEAHDVLELLAKPLDAARDEKEVQAYVAELQRREALVSEDVLHQHWEKEEVLNADEDDATTHELLQRARETRQRLRDALRSSAAADATAGGGGGSADAFSVTAKEAKGAWVASSENNKRSPAANTDERVEDTDMLLYHDAKYLYAFEMELPRMVIPAGTGDAIGVESFTTREGTSTSAVETSLPPQEDMSLLRLSSAPQETRSSDKAEADASLPHLILRSSALLDAMAAAEQRDTQLLQHFTREQEMRAQARQHFNSEHYSEFSGETTTKRNRDALGLVALPSFVERLDVLLSPTQAELQERARRQTRNSVKAGADTDWRNVVGVGGCAPHYDQSKAVFLADNATTMPATSAAPSASVSSASPSLEHIRRQAAIEAFLLERELEEGRRMRREDEMIRREGRAAEERVRLLAEQLAALQDDAVRVKDAVVQEEGVVFKEISAARVKDAALARQVEQLRQLQQIEALAYTLTMEWEVQREQLVQEEALTFRRLARDGDDGKAQAAAAAEKRVSVEAAAARLFLKRLYEVFEGWRAAFTSSTRPEESDGAFHKRDVRQQLQHSLWYDECVQPLLEERSIIVQWVLSQHGQVERVRDLLSEGEGHYRRHITTTLPATVAVAEAGRVLPVPAVPPAKDSSCEATVSKGAGTSLTAEKVLHLLWPSFRAAVLAPTQAAQYLARWCLSLEDIEAVNWEDMQSLAIAKEENMGKGTLCVAVPHLTKDIDLSGNALGVVDVLQAVRAFPLLQRLTLSHAQLTGLEAASLAQTQQTQPQQQQCSSARPVSFARLSATSVGLSESGRISSASSASHLRHISAARSHAVAEQVHLLVIDVSSNALSSLMPLGVMATASLTRCTAVDNHITSLDAVSACTQLRTLSVAHNRLQSVQCLHGLQLLRELDVGNNDLAEFSEEAGQTSGSGVSVNAVPLWSRLFLSHNHLRRLTSVSPCVYPCLSHLFINHNELTALDSQSMAWMPLLRVLQAEGNKITDISGLRHCTRLESLKLSYNLLSTVDAIRPVSSCRRLKVLDLVGNPLFPDGADSSAGARGATLFLCDALPLLTELNNARPRRPTEALNQADQTQPLRGSLQTAMCSIPEDAVEQAVLICTGVTRAAGSALDLDAGVRVAAVRQRKLYTTVFAALCWDGMVQHAQDERELREALISRALNRAKGWEATMMAPRETAYNDTSQDSSTSGTALYGITSAQRDTRRAEHEAEVNLFQLDRDTLTTWAAVAHQCKDKARPPNLSLLDDVVLFSNRHEVHSAYQQNTVDHLKSLARSYIAEWLLARVLVRRARRVLKDLQAAHCQSEAFRRETAARRIQPVWRGAALRSRLRRLLHGTKDAEDDDGSTFVKVDVNEWLTEDASALAPVALLLHSVVDVAQGMGAVPFDVPRPAAVPAKLGASNTELERAAPQASPLFTPFPPNGDPRRANTGTATATGRPSPRLAPPRTESATGVHSNGRRVEKPVSTADALEEQWGPAVAAQIRKKQQKNARANHERMRKEFMLDPLRVQQEMRGAQARHVSK
jgi:hypothetical protein